MRWLLTLKVPRTQGRFVRRGACCFARSRASSRAVRARDSSTQQLLPARPSPGKIVEVRQRRYLVEEVSLPPLEGEATLVSLSCIDDDAQGEPLDVLWEHEIDARVVTAPWEGIGRQGFDPTLTDAEVWAECARSQVGDEGHLRLLKDVELDTFLSAQVETVGKDEPDSDFFAKRSPLSIAPAAVSAWLERPEVVSRARSFRDGVRRATHKEEEVTDELLVRTYMPYVMLHSLSHRAPHGHRARVRVRGGEHPRAHLRARGGLWHLALHGHAGLRGHARGARSRGAGARTAREAGAGARPAVQQRSGVRAAQAGSQERIRRTAERRPRSRGSP